MRKCDSVGVAAPQVLLPKPGLDLTKWAVVACDQYTSQPEYWKDVDAFVGGEPSTLDLIYPEVYLSEPDPEARIRRIRAKMREYLDKGILVPFDGPVYVERAVAGRVRRGLVICVDLDRYDYRKGSTSLIRATEGTILERIPPRVRIRKGAPLESPHIMVLIDDPEDQVIGPLAGKKNRLRKLYDFELMMNSGHLTGFGIDDTAVEKGIVSALEGLADGKAFAEKYGLAPGADVLLFAMGDGNHSLATAKAIREEVVKEAGGAEAVRDHPARYALVELVNVHDAALEFEPIHRVVFGVRPGRDLPGEMAAQYAGRYRYTGVSSLQEMTAKVDAPCAGDHRIGAIGPSGFGVIEIGRPDHNLPVGSLQLFLDKFMKEGGAGEIDYVHGTDVVETLGRKEGNIGFYLPAMDKHELFKTVILDGALPRKTFSMGEAYEKRFYMECRGIV